MCRGRKRGRCEQRNWKEKDSAPFFLAVFIRIGRRGELGGNGKRSRAIEKERENGKEEGNGKRKGREVKIGKAILGGE